MLLLAGCSDPYGWHPGYWNAEQVNLANFAVQAADPRDIARGHGDGGSDGQEAAAAVARLRNGTVKPLPSLDIAGVGPSVGSTAGAAATPAN